MSGVETVVAPLKGEGEQKAVLRTRVRRECGNCGEPATKKHTFLLPGARRNSQSSAYGKDDCTWCSDHDTYSCDACSPDRRTPQAEGYEWCSTFLVANFPHMFLEWHEAPMDAALAAQARRVAELEGAVTAHVADLEKVAAIFREAGMTESAYETDAAVAELRAALKGQG